MCILYLKELSVFIIQVTCALREIFSVEESKVEVMNSYPRLLAAMLVRMASTVGTDPPKVSTVTNILLGEGLLNSTVMVLLKM